MPVTEIFAEDMYIPVSMVYPDFNMWTEFKMSGGLTYLPGRDALTTCFLSKAAVITIKAHLGAFLIK